MIKIMTSGAYQQNLDMFYQSGKNAGYKEGVSVGMQARAKMRRDSCSLERRSPVLSVRILNIERLPKIFGHRFMGEEPPINYKVTFTIPHISRTIVIIEMADDNFTMADVKRIVSNKIMEGRCK